MDQVKQILAGVQKHVFWIVSGLTVVLGIVGYWMSRSSMDKIFTDQSTKIDGQYSTLNQINNEVPTHPNDKSDAEMLKIVKRLEDDVQVAWQKQYERQAPLLVWPDKSILSERISSRLNKYRPIELTLDYPLEAGKDPLVRTDLNQYKQYFEKQFPALAQSIGTTWVGTPPVAGSAGGMGGMGAGGYGGMGMAGGLGSPDGGDGGYTGSAGPMGGMGGPGSGMNRVGPDGRLIKPDLVIWPKAVQDAVIADVQTWRGELPTTHDILYTQENIWILQGLLSIISNVNQKVGATANFQCTVKRIDFLRIGRTAVGRAGTIDPPPVLSSGATMGEGSSMMGEPGAMGDAMAGDGTSEGSSSMAGMVEDAGGMSSSDGGVGAAPMTIDPANGRYVDAAYKPLTGEDLRTKMKSSAPEDAYFAVAKRVPVRMRFLVDQRRLQSILAECGNANLMLEIRQIRIGDTIPAAASGSGGGGMMGGLGPGGGIGMPGGDGGYGGGMMGGSGGSGDLSSYGDMGMGGALGGAGSGGGGMGGMGMAGGLGAGGLGSSGSGATGSGTAAIRTSPIKSWDVPLEIYGVVYLFNPPDKNKLGVSKVTAETEVSDTVEVSADKVKPAEGTLVPESAPATDPAAQPANGQPNAQPANGQPAQRQMVNQPMVNQPMVNNGQPVNGQPVNGQPVNGGQPQPVGAGQPQPANGQPQPVGGPANPAAAAAPGPAANQ